MEVISEMTSAIKNAHHTLFTAPVCASSQAAGIRTTSCLITETISEYMLCPKAWKTELNTMPTAASGKWTAIVRSAVIHMPFISSEALNISRRVPGISSKVIVPINIIPKARLSAKRRDSSILFLFLAP